MILFVLLFVNVWAVSLSKSYETFVHPLIEMVEVGKKWENYVFSPASVQEVTSFVYPALTSEKKEEFAGKFGLNKTSFEPRDLISIFDELGQRNKIQTIEIKNDEEEYFVKNKKELRGVISANKLWVAGEMHMTDEYKDFVNTAGTRDGQKMVEKVSKANAKEIINNWIKNATQGEIQDIYQGESNFVFCNAMYLRYVWQFKMDDGNQYWQDFMGRDKYGNECKVPKEKVTYFGTRRHVDYSSSSSANYQAIRLPLSERLYGNQRLQFVIVLPHENEHLPLYYKYVTPSFNYFKQTWEKTDVSFQIPEFKIKTQKHNFDDFYALTASQLPGLGPEGNDPISLIQAATITVKKKRNHCGCCHHGVHPRILYDLSN